MKRLTTLLLFTFLPILTACAEKEESAVFCQDIEIFRAYFDRLHDFDTEEVDFMVEVTEKANQTIQIKEDVVLIELTSPTKNEKDTFSYKYERHGNFLLLKGKENDFALYQPDENTIILGAGYVFRK